MSNIYKEKWKNLLGDWHRIHPGVKFGENVRIGEGTVVEDGCASGSQKSPGCPAGSDDLIDHIRWAEKVWKEHGTATVEGGGCDNGHMILTHKGAWEDAGGFNQAKGMHCDGDYYKRIMNAGYKAYYMPGNYVYHLQNRKYQVWKWHKWKDYGHEWRVL